MIVCLFQTTATSRVDGSSGASAAADDAGRSDDAAPGHGAAAMEPRGRRDEQHEHAMAAAGEHAAATGRDAAAATTARLYYAAQHSAVNAVDGRQQSTAATRSNATYADSSARNGHTAVAAGSTGTDAATTAGHGTASGIPRWLAAATDGWLAPGCPCTASASTTDPCTTWD